MARMATVLWIYMLLACTSWSTSFLVTNPPLRSCLPVTRSFVTSMGSSWGCFGAGLSLREEGNVRRQGLLAKAIMTESGLDSLSRRSLLCFSLLELLVAAQPSNAATKLGDDEFELSFGPGSLGIDVVEVRFPFNAPPERQSSRIIVNALKPESQAEILGKEKRLRSQVLIVSVDGINIEGLVGKKAVQVLVDAKKQADAEGRDLKIVFRDPLIFKEKLLNSKVGDSLSTNVGAGSKETLTITTTKTPTVCGAVRAQQGDVLEVKYTGYLADSMEVFDGSSINAQGGFFGDFSIYFVLNQGQRQAPRAWEVGMLGMCIGETRRLVVPPSLGYGEIGVPKGKIMPKLPVPPNATLIYDVTLVGINGINIPTDDVTSQGTRIPFDYRGCAPDKNGKILCGDDVPDKRL